MFWQLLRESTLIQALLALVLLGVISYMYLAGMTVPEPLVNFFALILGYYFGSKAALTAAAMRSR
jgi:hypothetical protein